MNAIDNLRFIGRAEEDEEKHPHINRLYNVEQIVKAMIECLSEEELDKLTQVYDYNRRRG